ncbi:unnamed protein product [Arctogadus glacialis]
MRMFDIGCKLSRSSEDVQRTIVMMCKMAATNISYTFVLFLQLFNLAVAKPGSCYNISVWNIGVFVAADVLLTLCLVIATFMCAVRRRNRIASDQKVYMNVRPQLKSK